MSGNSGDVKPRSPPCPADLTWRQEQHLRPLAATQVGQVLVPAHRVDVGEHLPRREPGDDVALGVHRRHDVTLGRITTRQAREERLRRRWPATRRRRGGSSAIVVFGSPTAAVVIGLPLVDVVAERDPAWTSPDHTVIEPGANTFGSANVLEEGWPPPAGALASRRGAAAGAHSFGHPARKTIDGTAVPTTDRRTSSPLLRCGHHVSLLSCEPRRSPPGPPGPRTTGHRVCRRSRRPRGRRTAVATVS